MEAVFIWIIILLLVMGAFVTGHRRVERWIDNPHNKALPTYEPEPILPMYEDQLEAKVQYILDSRTKNPRHVRDYQFRTSWNREYRRLDPVDRDNTHVRVEDDEDQVTIRDWGGSIIRHSTLSHPSNETCYKCERKRQL